MSLFPPTTPNNFVPISVLVVLVGKYFSFLLFISHYLFIYLIITFLNWRIISIQIALVSGVHHTDPVFIHITKCILPLFNKRGLWSFWGVCMPKLIIPDMNWSDKSWSIMMHIFWKSDQTHLSPLVIPKGDGE